MEAMGQSLEELSARTQSWARRQPGLGAVLLFGSRAKGTARPTSDWDICCIVESSCIESRYGIWLFHAEA